jgi:hypothetical protein
MQDLLGEEFVEIAMRLILAFVSCLRAALPAWARTGEEADAAHRLAVDLKVFIVLLPAMTTVSLRAPMPDAADSAAPRRHKHAKTPASEMAPRPRCGGRWLG